jgi:hypothetical protein
MQIPSSLRWFNSCKKYLEQVFDYKILSGNNGSDQGCAVDIGM